MNYLRLPHSLDHLCDLWMTHLSPLVAVLSQYGYLTPLSLHVSLLTGIVGLVPVVKN